MFCPKCYSDKLSRKYASFFVAVDEDGEDPSEFAQHASNTELTDDALCRDCGHRFEWEDAVAQCESIPRSEGMPESARYLAWDADGRCWAFDARPHRVALSDHQSGRFWDGEGAESYPQKDHEHQGDWRESLRRIEG